MLFVSRYKTPRLAGEGGSFFDLIVLRLHGHCDSLTSIYRTSTSGLDDVAVGPTSSSEDVGSCMVDMCECPNGRCYCESFTAYAHECQRLGVNLMDWRRETHCPSGDTWIVPMKLFIKSHEESLGHMVMEQTISYLILHASPPTKAEGAYDHTLKHPTES
uniref:VWF/SSPO/Zonadhesin-like cysteine-rich domain-containing protein n=1 Tax=Timema tahoe TaxID=61484 RepID=A0A7R9P063_9NEOP|nr:unnamed protein product [Timema tahoe]